MNNKHLVANRLVYDKEKMRVIKYSLISSLNIYFRNMSFTSLVLEVLGVCLTQKLPNNSIICRVELMRKPNNLCQNTLKCKMRIGFC